MLATSRFKFEFFKHFLKLKACHCFCSSTINFPANPSPKTLNQLLNRRPPLLQLKQIHAQIITQSLSSRSVLIDSLIHCYLSTKNLICARTLFDQYPFPSPPVLLWNIMIRSYSKISNSREAISLFCRLRLSEDGSRVVPDEYTFTFLITSCTHQMSELHGMIVHGMIIKNGYLSNLHVSNSILSLYAGFSRLDDAWKVFDEMLQRDVYSWTSLLRGHAKQGEMGRACEILAKMPVRNEVSWAVTISGFLECGRYGEALKYFHDMLREDHSLKPNEAVLVSALSACAHLGALDQGKWIHVYMDKNGFNLGSNVLTALIDMYAKCGMIDTASRVFHNISQPDVCNYTSMISGFSAHGLGRDALRVFYQMLAENIVPNEVTLLGVLKGCSHSGLVEEGSSIFYNMESLWSIEPKMEHYGCFVDLLSRAGYLKRALGIVIKMPLDPDIVIWRSLLSACRIYKDVTLADRIDRYIEGRYNIHRNGGNVLLSNLYASLSKWERVHEVRILMGDRMNESKTDPGCSWIEMKGVVHEFRVDDQLHPEIVKIQEKLDEILKRASLEGEYVANSMQASFDLMEEEKEQAVARHSEKLAVAFGLMSTEPGTCIRIVKNLRTCEDCHSALKSISKVYSTEIIVRDRSRFHTFKEGKCSCNDYW